MRAISEEVVMNLIHNMRWESMFYKLLLPRLPEANALMSKGKVEIWIAVIYGDLQSVVWQEFFLPSWRCV